MNAPAMQHHMLTPDGLTLTVEEAGAGLPLIFAHGLTSNRAQSRRQLFHLADRFHVIVFDQRGHAICWNQRICGTKRAPIHRRWNA